jgi:hypothetical protein
MITVEIYETNTTFQLVDKWEELIGKDYLYMCKLINLVQQNEISILELRTLFVAYILNIGNFRKHNMLKKSTSNKIYSNLEYLGKAIRFPLKLDWNFPDNNPLSAELIEKLNKYEPSEIMEEHLQEEIEKYSNLIFIDADGDRTPNAKYTVDLNFAFNPLPIVNINNTFYHGPKFSTKKINGSYDIHTDITATQFIEAYTYYYQYAITADIDNIKSLFNSLYNEVTERSSQYKVVESDEETVLMGVYYWFSAMMQFFSNKTIYSLIWTGQSSDKFSLGMVSEVFSLSKKGYGSVSEIENTDLLKYFDMIIHNIIEYLNEMKFMVISKRKDYNQTQLRTYKLTDSEYHEIENLTGYDSETLKSFI